MRQEKRKKGLEKYHRLNEYFKWLLLGVITLTVTVSLYPRLIVKQHAYLLGDVVDTDVKAPKDFLFEDRSATELNVRAAVESVRTVYDHDMALAGELTQQVNDAFETMQKTVQEGVAAMPDIFDPKDPPGLSPLEKEMDKRRLEVARGQQIKKKIWEQKPEFEKKLGIVLNSGAFTILEKESFTNDIALFISKILSEVLDNGVVTNKEILLKEAEKGITLRQIEE